MRESKRRMMVSVLENFIREDTDCRVGILLGIRRTGKSFILNQLKETFPGAALINFEESAAWDQYLAFLRDDGDLLLIDEVTRMYAYEDAVRKIEHDVHNGGKKFRVIFTGSSYMHLRALYGSVLGGGRSKLFRLPILSFVEYLNFVGKIPHNNYDAGEILSGYRHDPQDFYDYLDLKDLENLGASGLRFTLDENYLTTMYDDVEASNNNCILSSSGVKITGDDIRAIGGMIAYTLSDHMRYGAFTALKGEREAGRIAGIGSFNPEMLGDAKINIDIREFRNILPPERRAKVLQFLLRSNLAYVEFQHELKEKYSLQQLLADIDAVAKKRDFADIIDNYNICLINPLLYTRLGKDILQKYKIDQSVLYHSFIKGLLVENYIKGAYCATLDPGYYTLCKIGGNKAPGEDMGEVDLYDEDNGVLMEIATYDKPAPNLPKYFKNEDLIRILSSDKDEMPPVAGGTPYHRIPFTKLCILVDTGKIFNLQTTKINNKQ